MFKKVGVILEHGLEYTVESLIAVAIMKEEPLLIVEGTDDVEFYKKITDNTINVKCSELLSNSEGKKYLPGCEGVIDIIGDMQNEFAKNSLLEKLVLGIIDADYRRFLGTTNENLKGLFILKYYSYESHFCTADSIRNFISSLTSVTVSEITDEIITYATAGIEEMLNDLYYVGLEALLGKKEGKKSLISYDWSPEAIYERRSGKTIIEQVREKKAILDDFATEQGIKFSDYPYIIRGKWLLYMYAKSVYENIQKIKEMCGNAEIEQCDFCRQASRDKCIWGKRMELKRGQLVHHYIYNNLNEPQIVYIKERIAALGC